MVLKKKWKDEPRTQVKMQNEKHFSRENERERKKETPRGEIDLSHLPISKEEPLSLDVNRGQVGNLDIYSHM